MINKESFCEIMNSLRGYNDEIGKLEDALNVYFEKNFMTKAIDNIMYAITLDAEKDIKFDDEYGHWCYYFAYELDFGRSRMAKDTVTIDNVAWSLNSAEELYDLLVELNKKEKHQD